MTAAMVNIIVLTITAAMLAVVMLIAWRSFEKPRPAMLWLIAYTIAIGQWSANLVLRLAAGDSPFLHVVIAWAGCLFNALIAAGFVQRNREQAKLPALLTAATLAAMLMVVLTFVIPHRGLRDASGLMFGGAMMVVGAANVARSFKASSLPERAVGLMLVLFAATHFGLAALAFGQGPVGQGAAFVQFRSVLVLLYPTAFVGVGIFSVFLLAADLAANLQRLATADPLTGIYNRRGFEDSAERAIRNAQRQHQPLTVVIADIDNFKTINDRHGHGVGDRALRHFATRLGRLVRRGDLIGRIGGEEFAILLVNTRAEDSLEVVERIRRDIAAMPVDGPAAVVMTASFGVTGLRPGDIALAALLARADRALYRSKREGRDRVTSAEDLDETV